MMERGVSAIMFLIFIYRTSSLHGSHLPFLSLGLLQSAEHTCGTRIFFLVHCADVSKMT